jgi:hypothetical protein
MGPAVTAPAELEQTLERHIAQRTWGRLRALRVEVTENRVIVRGSTQWYYVKQLAIQAVLEALGPASRLPFEVDIEVATNGPLRNVRCSMTSTALPRLTT